MVYGDFTKEQLETDFGIEFEGANTFPTFQPIKPSNWLIDTLQKGRKLGIKSEKSRSERIVYPILTELAQLNDFQFTIYSGEQLNADKNKGLNGECDFIFSWSQMADFV